MEFDLKSVITVVTFIISISTILIKQVSDQAKASSKIDGLTKWSRSIDEKISKNDLDENTTKIEIDRLKGEINILRNDKVSHDKRITDLEKMWERIDEKLNNINNTINELVKEMKNK
jgi:chromosome segregation ATPase